MKGFWFWSDVSWLSDLCREKFN